MKEASRNANYIFAFGYYWDNNIIEDKHDLQYIKRRKKNHKA